MRVISGLDFVIHLVCVYNNEYYACDQWLRFGYVKLMFKLLFCGLHFVLYVACNTYGINCIKYFVIYSFQLS